MRAKRSKKYRKLMHQYELAFGFREAYQVLVDSNFLRAVDSFKMDLIPALERTVQGKTKPLLTKCSLAALMANQPINPRTNQPYRPYCLPPPTILPLRHCSHNKESTPIDEVECLLSLLSPSTEVKKNKEHYILATADPIVKKKDDNTDSQQRKRKRDEDREEEQALRRARQLRVRARSIPGVPIIYVKRSVMVLEPMSNPSETVRDGVERDKFRVGLPEERQTDAKPEGELKKIRGLKKAKGPNPLSVKKTKKRTDGTAAAPRKEKKPQAIAADSATADVSETPDGNDSSSKPKRRRRHHKGGPREGNEDTGLATEAGQAMEVDA
ncbi:hypothetical protein N7462_006698 [Penicillium macrosclerotiorum]|uniref:uncharacterized protein n=1 Tax=Penicillium macrosclerotiorum TaxID=303699 RepID=UPI00254994FB|nr:uncharacterized protein N7462_006698 [Penicillium macrosclerotiorum]KAJ5683533.1 hypothetical protein N7462_006698 [Penicillium macrosclerotiorum]